MPNGNDHRPIKILKPTVNWVGYMDQWKELKAIEKQCKKAGVPIPKEVTEKLKEMEKPLPLEKVGRGEYLAEVGERTIRIKINIDWG